MLKIIKCTHPVLVPVGHHHKQHHLIPSRRALRQQHVVGPAAAAEVELGGRRGARVSRPGLLVAERALVRNGHGRLRAAAADGVVPGPY